MIVESSGKVQIGKKKWHWHIVGKDGKNCFKGPFSEYLKEHMNDELTTEPNIEKIEDKNNEANQDLSKDKVTGDTSRVFLPFQIWIVNLHVKNPVKISQ